MKYMAALFFILFPVLGQSATVQVGHVETKDLAPFGITASGNAAYTGEYQQIYASSAFSSPALITQVAFATRSNISVGGATYNLSVGLGITSRTPASPGKTFQPSFTTVYSGQVSAAFTLPEGDFDLPILLTLPFSYDPQQGNLLLDVVLSSVQGNSSYLGFIFAADDNTLMGETVNSGNSVVARPNFGLMTQFTTAAVPEPGSMVYLLCGILLIGLRLFARRCGAARL